MSVSWWWSVLLAVLPAVVVHGQRIEEWVEKPFAQLSHRELSDWGRAALAIRPEKWRHGETQHFIIHFFRNGSAIARRCEESYVEIREFFGNPPDRLGARKSHVFAFHEAADWNQFKPVTGLSNVAGVTREHEFFYLATTATGHYDWEGKVQAHEMTHLVFNRFLKGAIPLWLNEGIAEYFGQRKTSTTAEFRRRLSQATPYPLAMLFEATRYPNSVQEVQSFYAEAAIVVDFLTHSTERRALLPKFVDVLERGQPLAEAWRIYGYAGQEAFEKAYERFRKTRYQ
ncbi:MAG: hypothetical protein N3A53_04790 [Verrucomicrobiae bacterium]|nr:hypothetical protein [Verrucomicrobiae bacterium]